MYRKVRSYFEAVTLLREYDYFAKQKENALTCCTEALETVVQSTRNSELSADFFIKLLKVKFFHSVKFFCCMSFFLNFICLLISILVFSMVTVYLFL